MEVYKKQKGSAMVDRAFLHMQVVKKPGSSFYCDWLTGHQLPEITEHRVHVIS